MGTVVHQIVLLAVVMALGASPALAHEPDRDYSCLGDCLGISIRDEQTGEVTLLLEGFLERGAHGTGLATDSWDAEIGPIWIDDGSWEVALEGLCEADSEPTDGSISVEFDLMEGEAPARAVTLDYVGGQVADTVARREGISPFRSTTQSIHLGPTGWGVGEYRMSVSATSDTADLCAWDVVMTSVPAGASD